MQGSNPGPRSSPGMEYRLIHGIRYGEEAYDREAYTAERYIPCTSRDESGRFRGRVTDYLKAHPPGEHSDYYLCGNSKMIHEIYDILIEQGVDTNRIHAEVYF